MRKNGFTFIELLISLTVWIILLGFGLGSWAHLKHRNERQILISEIKLAVRYANLQAINYNRPLLLSSKNASSNWSEGMNLTSIQSNNTEKLIHQWSWKKTDWDVRWMGANGLNHIVITGTASHAMSNGRFILRNKHTDERIELVLNRLGRVKQA